MPRFSAFRFTSRTSTPRCANTTVRCASKRTKRPRHCEPTCGSIPRESASSASFAARRSAGRIRWLFIGDSTPGSAPSAVRFARNGSATTEHSASTKNGARPHCRTN
uniref:(northern house mosquito) hypothetical protein n=1 Tax=Culex pipiens TaxID=7175 RepID=A0A8D8MX52_CULPI